MKGEPEEAMNHVEQVLEHSEWLSALASHLVRDPSEAEDLVQDTWFAALRSGPRDKALYRPWLNRVLRNLANLSFRKRERRCAREQLAASREKVAGPEESVQKLEIFRLVVEVVLSLDDSSRDVVILRYFEGLSGAEIARRLDVKPSAIRMRLKRALEQLRAELDRRHGDDRSVWLASVAILIPVTSGMMPGSSTAPAAHAGGARPSGWKSVGSTATVALCVCVAFAVGWGTRGSSSDVLTTSDARQVEECTDAPLHELRDAIREANAILDSQSTALDSVHTRLAALEEAVQRAISGNPA